ncbi:MAG: 16S rRNA (adenine(1518)-N(6)/adenine(1519)-N(6))-dimethyltransferase RsmA [Candidatus Thermoplasmatota archaeon]|nr:16S rRNA (adenine(1518)-N(6)/adenine(1519)-N(6))-dimethyltransferase RsmA [Candidatus Thermoplasmatota archaeon]
MGYRKKMGQHFLVDQGVARRQIELAELEPCMRVLEIGGGHGVLTALLADSVGPENLVCIEKDEFLAQELEARFPEVEILHGDALDIEWPKFDAFVSNIPYAISSLLTMKLCASDFDIAVVMYQEEFAYRMCSGPGTKDYSRLGVKVQYGHQCEYAFRVSSGAFSPPPKVGSAVVVLTKIEPEEEAMDVQLFFNLVDILFAHRRKMAGKNILEAADQLVEPEQKEELRGLICEWGLGEERVEMLEIEDIVEMSNMIFELRG